MLFLVRLLQTLADAYEGKVNKDIFKYRGSPLCTIFGILKKTYYVKFVLVSTTQPISTSTVYSTSRGPPVVINKRCSTYLILFMKLASDGFSRFQTLKNETFSFFDFFRSNIRNVEQTFKMMIFHQWPKLCTIKFECVTWNSILEWALELRLDGVSSCCNNIHKLAF